VLIRIGSTPWSKGATSMVCASGSPDDGEVAAEELFGGVLDQA
jgi:hypothetical protein